MTILKSKLEAYRREKSKTAIKTMSDSKNDDLQGDETPLILMQSPTGLQEKSNDSRLRLCENPDVIESVEDNETNYIKEKSLCNYAINVLYFLFWACLYGIAIEMGFGAVYFILSMLIFMWINTSSSPKKKGEPSAYSVFNPNCEAIDGTLDASQFEREIRYGMPAMR